MTTFVLAGPVNLINLTKVTRISKTDGNEIKIYFDNGESVVLEANFEKVVADMGGLKSADQAGTKLRR